MLDPEFTLAVRGRRWTCVVDPLLALASPGGAQLVQRLAQVAEVWVTRAFWQALDASEFHRRDPLAFWPEPLRAALPADAADGVVGALAVWERARARTDLAHCRLNWLNDSLSESALPEQAPADLIERYEALHESLVARGDPAQELRETLGFLGATDALALTAALGTARLVTRAIDSPRSCLAASARALELPLDAVGGGALADTERRRWNDLLVQAAAAPLLWGGESLAVVQLALPDPLPPPAAHDDLALPGLEEDELALALGDARAAATWRDAWVGARAFALDLHP